MIVVADNLLGYGGTHIIEANQQVITYVHWI